MTSFINDIRIFFEQRKQSYYANIFLLFRFVRGKRKVWKKPGRTDIWWQNLLCGKLPEEEWKKIEKHNICIGKTFFHEKNPITFSKKRR